MTVPQTLTRIRAEATILRSPDDVFAYVTTAANWPVWHPSSVQVTGAADHPLDVGEACVEEYVVAGRRGVVTWTVRERVAGRRWVIDATPPGGGYARITYTLSAVGDETLFVRELEYEMPNPWLGLLDRLVIRRRVTAESKEAVRRLERVLETQSDSITTPS
jgi:uncharacterized protein YndB with AHSA1/START domain